MDHRARSRPSSGWALETDVAAIEAAEPSGAVRLLPAFDQYVVAAPRDDRATPAPERIYRPGGWFSPVLLVDGVMAGVWALEDDVVTIEPFGEGRQGRARGRRGRSRAASSRTRASAGANLRATPPLVTISASYGAGGSRIGPALAQRLGVEFLDRAIPTRVADRLHVPLDDALAHDESLGDAIGRLASSFALLPELAGAMVQAGVLAGEDYRRETEKLIREHTDGGAVILGRAGAVILRDHADALHVRLDGPPERRVAQRDGARGPRRARRRAPAPRRRPRARGLRAPLLRLRRTRPRALPPRDRLDHALHARPWSR